MKPPLFLGAILFLVAASILPTTTTETKVKVEIFYETLNDAIRQFFVDQFRLVSSQLLPQIDLRLYPYGATTKNGTTYVCPFGEQQCFTNQIHACFIDVQTIDENADSIDTPINAEIASSFIGCFFANRYAESSLETLTTNCLPTGSGATWQSVNKCAKRDTMNGIYGEFTEAEVGAAIKTDGLVVRIGGEINDAAKGNLLGEVCKALTNTEGICASSGTTPTKVKIAVYYEALNADAANYLIKQLGTYYHVLEDFIDLDLIPYGNTELAGSQYNCPLGEVQCVSNKFQALVVHNYLKPINGDLVSGPNRAVNFIRCLSEMTEPNSEENIYSELEICTKQALENPSHYIEYTQTIKENSAAMKSVFEAMRVKTEGIAGKGNALTIPTITINGEINANAFEDLVQEACAKYTGHKASICTKVPLTVLYEPLNHPTRNLFLEQLSPAFESLYSFLLLKLLPGGRATVTNAPTRTSISCPDGSIQCSAMQVHACALEKFWNTGHNYMDATREQIFQFLKCTFRNTAQLEVLETAEMCAKLTLDADDWFIIRGCLAEPEAADTILQKYIQETQMLVPDIAEKGVVPVVFINDEQLIDLNSLKTKICGFFNDYHAPDFCLSPQPSKLKLSVFYEGTSPLSRIFFTTQYSPWYQYIEEMVDISLLPAGNSAHESTADGTCTSYETNSPCLANTLQAVVINRFSNQDGYGGDYLDGQIRLMQFLSCVFSREDWSEDILVAYENCTTEVLPLDSWPDLLTKAKSPEGATIYKAVLEATAKFKTENGLESLDPVPWIALGDQIHSQAAATDLLQTVCGLFTGPHPLECTPVHLQVYYSALNAPSREFILHQLTPVFSHLRPRIDLDLVPYGLVDPTLDLPTECASHEPQICTGNTLQACAIEAFFKDPESSTLWDGRNETVTWMNCLFKNVVREKDILSLAEQCANNEEMSKYLLNCAQNQTGADALAEMRSRSLELAGVMDHLPWVVVNGIHSQTAESSLKSVICEVMLGDRPDFCFSESPDKVQMDFHYSSGDLSSAAFFRKQLYPVFNKLEEILALDVVPFGQTTALAHTQDDNYTLICPNGLVECQANLLHGCLYQQFYHNTSDSGQEFSYQILFIEFLSCYFNSPNQDLASTEQCAKSIFGSDAYDEAKDCSSSMEGAEILVEFKQSKVDALRPSLVRLPWITIDGSYSYTAEDHLQRTICDAYRDPEKPADCMEQNEENPEKPTIQIHYEPGNAECSHLFTAALDPDHVTSIGNLTLIPFGRSIYDDTTQQCISSNGSCWQYKEHACLLDLHLELQPIPTLQTINCTFFGSAQDEDIFSKCINETLGPDSLAPIQECLTSTRADELLKHYSNLVASLTPKLSHIPWILINDQQSLTAETHPLDALCSAYYPPDKPEICQPELASVEIYYETQNANVSDFFIHQLDPYAEYLDEMGHFTFVPFGTAQLGTDGVAVCESTEQCKGNKIQACLLHHYYNDSDTNLDPEANRIRTIHSLVCLFAAESENPSRPSNATQSCLESYFDILDIWTDIKTCAEGDEGNTLLAEMGRQTATLDQPPLEAVPYITIDSNYSSTAEVNLFQALCDSYPITKPPMCFTLPNYAVDVAIYFSANTKGRQFFLKHLLPFYSDVLYEESSESTLSSLLNPTLVPWGDTQYNPANSQNPFTCSGTNECFINRFFACAIHYHSDGENSAAQGNLLRLALCFFESNNALSKPQPILQKCVNRIWWIQPNSYTNLLTCATAKTQAAYDIFLHGKEKTENNWPILTSFPAITIDNQHNPTAEIDLLYVICEQYKGYNRPAVCEGLVEPTTLAPTTTVDPGSGESGVKGSAIFLLFAVLFSILTGVRL